VRTRGSCKLQTDLFDRIYGKMNTIVMDNLIWDVVLVRDLSENI